jgi:MtrB/PioB family decaheme-associated outer membrane protein
MNANAKSTRKRDLPQRALCVAIGIALAFPLALSPTAVLAQDVQSVQRGATSPEDDPSQPVEEPEQVDPLALDDTTEQLAHPGTFEDPTHNRTSIEFGAIYTSDSSFRFGRYTGLNEQGISALLNLDLFHSYPYDGGNARYWSFKGSNLGLDSREVAVELGDWGKYKVRIDYDQIPSFRSDSARTIFDGAGTSNLTLPANWVGSSTTAGMTQLLPALKSVDLRTERRRAGIGATVILSPHWNYSTSYKHETKEGTKTIGGVFGNSGGNPRSAILPEPVDYTTQQFDASLNYATRKLQVVAAYYLSLFSDQNDALVWSNPYTTIGGWAPGTGFPDGRGQLSLPPDNRFHQFSLNAGYNLTDRTRLSASASRGRMTQNDTFLPYTNIPSLADSITQPLPRSSLDGRIDTTVVNLRISSRPWQDFSWNASYRFDDRDNKTPRDEYVYIGGDSQLQQTQATSNRRRFNDPYSYKEQQYKADANYRVFGRVDVSAGVQHSRIDRTFSERKQTDETTYKFGLNGDFTERFSANVRYTHANRDGSTYVGNEPFLSSYSPGYTATVPGTFENLPGLRRSFLADRDRDQLTASASFMPIDAWTLSASLDRAKDAYNKSELGLIDSRIDGYTIESVIATSPFWSIHAFFSHEKLVSNQDGRSFSGGAAQLTTGFDPNRNWSVEHRDVVDSYGAGYKRSPEAGRLDYGVDVLYSKTRSDLNFAVGSALSARPLPRDVTRLESLTLYCNYKMRANTALRLGYWYERYHSADWSVDGIDPDQLANVILLGETSPNYKVHVVSLSVTHRF